MGELKERVLNTQVGTYMNRKAIAVFLFALLLAGLLLVSVQPIMALTLGPLRFKDGVTVYSPVNAIYNSKNILFNYTFAVGLGMHYSLNYMLDGSEAQAMPYSVVNPQELHVVYSALGQVQLPELSEGAHSLTISLDASFGKNDIRSYSDTIYFTIDTNAPDFTLDTAPPKIIIQSPQTNQTYTATVPLNLLLSEPVTQLIVRLDGNKTILPAQNTTLEGLTIGTHTLSVDAFDLAGNPGYSYYVTFNVIQPTPTLQPTPTPTNSEHPTTNTGAEPPKAEPIPTMLLPVVFIVAVALVITGLLFYHKKHKP